MVRFTGLQVRVRVRCGRVSELLFQLDNDSNNMKFNFNAFWAESSVADGNKIKRLDNNDLIQISLKV